MKEKRKYDCVVVGGGPAGAAAAKRLVTSGARVLLIEKKKMPRIKICSGLLGTRAQDKIDRLFGELPLSVQARPNWVKARRVSIEGNEFVEKPLDLIVATGMERRKVLQVWRSKFDQWLVQLSKAEVQEECQFLDFTKKGKSLLIQCRQPDGRGESIKTDFLIGADGGNSAVRKRLDPSFGKKLHWLFSYKVYFQGTVDLEPGYFYCFLHKEFGDFYSALLHKDDFITLGTTVNEGYKIKPFFTKYIEYLRKRCCLVLGSPLCRMGCWVNDMGSSGRFYLGRERIILVGEAAGFLNIMGEGISSALGTGDIAGQAILEGIQAGRDAGKLYQELIEPEMDWTQKTWASGSQSEDENKTQAILKSAIAKV